MQVIHWNAEPVCVVVGGIPIYYYSLCFLAGTLFTIVGLRKIFRDAGMPWSHLQWLVVLSTMGLFLGARLGHCLFYEPEYFLRHPLEIFLPVRQAAGGYIFSGYQGMASHGGAAGLILALLLYVRMTGERMIPTLDCVAVMLPVAAGFIRIGNFMNSEMIGMPTNQEWGIVFDRVDTLARHPAQLYEALFYFLVFGINGLLYRKFGIFRYPGFFWGSMLILVFSARLGIEFLKETQVPFEQGMILNMGQLLSLPFILVGGCFLYYAFRNEREV